MQFIVPKFVLDKIELPIKVMPIMAITQSLSMGKCTMILS